MSKHEIIHKFLPTDNTTIVPIEEVTYTTPPPMNGGGAFIINPLFMNIIIGFVLAVLLLWGLKRWARKHETRTLDEVNPSLTDLDSTAFSLGTYLAIQGGIGILVSTACTLSLVFVLINPLITVLSCAGIIGMMGYARERTMNWYRANYKNRQNLEGYLRDKMGEKHRYSWSNVKFMTPYTPDEVMYRSLAAEVAKVNAEALKNNTEIKDAILAVHKKIEKQKEKLSKTNLQILKGKIILPPPDEEPDDKSKNAERFVPFNEDEIEEMRKPITTEIQKLERKAIELGEQIPKEIDLDELVANPVFINDRYLVVVISRDVLKNRIDFVEWYDYDIFGEFKVPTAGPEMREVSTFHRVKESGDDNKYRLDEYIPVFASIFDDGHSRAALRPIEAVDLETNDIVIAMAKAMGVERKHTAGEINTSKALTSDLLNEERDFDLLVDARSDAKAMKIIEADRKLKSLNKMVDWVSPSMVILAVIFTVGVILGFLLGQNSILLG